MNTPSTEIERAERDVREWQRQVEREREVLRLDELRVNNAQYGLDKAIAKLESLRGGK
jgi:hypothetical protein